MADTILSARMSDEELLKSIDSTLGVAEKRFDTFINNINTKLKSIGGTATGGKSAGSNINVDNVINLDQLDSAVKSSKDFSTGMDKATNSAKKMKKELSELGKAKQSTAEEKVNLELLKRQALLEKERTIRARIANESQRAAKAESLGKIAIGGQSYDSAMGMSSNSIQERIDKIKALQNVQKNLSTTESSYSSKLASTNREISNLKKANQEALTSGIALEKHNNKLISSFENLGKRVIFLS